MFWILSGTFLSGLLTTRILFELDVRTLWLRYSLSVLIAYLAFLVLIRLWLWYISRSIEPQVDIGGDGLDVAAELLSNLRVDPLPLGGGGQFGGGGATGSWGDAVIMPDSAAASSAPGSNAPGCGIDGGDEGCLIVVLIAVVLALVVASAYVIWAAPAILAEVAFEAALAAALARSAKRIDRPGWVGAVSRATMWPFIAVLFFAIAFGAYAQHHCPEANRLADVLSCTTNEK